MRNNGFTLLETIVYIALFGLIMSGAIASAYQLLEGGRRNQTAISIQEEGTFLSRKINWALLGATDIVVVHTPNEKVMITRPNLALATPPAGGQSPLIIEATGTTMTISRGTDSPVELSGDVFKITDVSFTKIDPAGGRPAAFDARFSINGKPFIFKTYLRQ